jgi:hypothetical protein
MYLFELAPASLRLDRNRPEILTPPQHPPDCCNQQTITVPPPYQFAADFHSRRRCAMSWARSSSLPLSST